MKTHKVNKVAFEFNNGVSVIWNKEKTGWIVEISGAIASRSYQTIHTLHQPHIANANYFAFERNKNKFKSVNS